MSIQFKSIKRTAVECFNQPDWWLESGAVALDQWIFPGFAGLFRKQSACNFKSTQRQ